MQAALCPNHQHVWRGVLGAQACGSQTTTCLAVGAPRAGLGGRPPRPQTVDNGREKRRKQRKIVVPFLLRGRDSMGFQHPLAKSNPMSWTLLLLESSADYCTYT
jgi:hypothetical protein